MSSTMLWDKLLKDMDANTPWQRLKSNLLLLLQLLAALLLVLVLLRPYLPQVVPLAGDTIVLVDASATMQATDTDTSRFEEAKRRLDDMIARLGQGRLAVIRVGQQPEVVSALSGNQSMLRQTSKKLRPGYGKANFPAAFALAEAMARKSTDPLIVIISDGVNLPTEVKFNFPVSFNHVGERNNDIGIENLSTRYGDNGLVGLIKVKNYSEKSVSADMELAADGNLMDVRSITLGPNESQNVFWQNKGSGTKVLEARLVVKDDFILDNTAAAVVKSRAKSEGVLVTRGNIFLERALTLSPQITLYKTTPEDFRPGEFDFYVFDGWMPKNLPLAPALVVNPPGDQTVFPLEGSVGPAFIESATGSALLEFVQFKDVLLAEARTLHATPNSKLLTAAGSTIAATFTINNSRQAVFAFDLHDTDLALKPGFPILINNLLDWLVPPGAVLTPAVTAGESVSILLNPKAIDATVSGPNGGEWPLRTGLGQTLFTGEYPGLYSLRQTYSGGKEDIAYFSVSIPPLGDNGILPQEVSSDYDGTSGGTQNGAGKYELWRWLAFMLLLVIAAEWWVFTNGY